MMLIFPKIFWKCPLPVIAVFPVITVFPVNTVSVIVVFPVIAVFPVLTSLGKKFHAN
jgi:hypothetical protein